ncbi:MAG: hypothetical protein GY861_24405 [bacterium]|nr:hypothetical protein [bacterium]
MADPKATLEQVIQTGIDSALKELHTALPGVVVSFDGDTQLADIQITIKRKLNDVLVNLPLLVGVPVRFLKTADFSISVPVKVDDHVLVIFAERSIDTWLTQGGIQSPVDVRKHSLSDGFAIPMMYDQTDVISNFDADNLQIRTTSGKGITIDPTGLVSIASNNTSLLTEIEALVDATKAITTFGSPGSHSVTPTSQTALENALTEIKKVLMV